MFVILQAGAVANVKRAEQLILILEQLSSLKLRQLHVYEFLSSLGQHYVVELLRKRWHTNTGIFVSNLTASITALSLTWTSFRVRNVTNCIQYAFQLSTVRHVTNTKRRSREGHGVDTGSWIRDKYASILYLHTEMKNNWNTWLYSVFDWCCTESNPTVLTSIIGWTDWGGEHPLLFE